jgi:hypothetical protein
MEKPMSIETYAARRHSLNALSAKHTVAKRIAAIRSRPSLKNAFAKLAVRTLAKPASNKTAAHADRLRRLARAETAVGPAPKPRALRPVGPEACSSFTIGGGLAFDPAPVCYAVDGATAATGAAKRMRLQSTHQQRQQRLARAEADLRR